MFDPMLDLPQNDEQAECAIRYGKDALSGNAAVGIYQCCRLQGGTVIDAYEVALKAILAVCKAADELAPGNGAYSMHP